MYIYFWIFSAFVRFFESVAYSRGQGAKFFLKLNRYVGQLSSCTFSSKQAILDENTRKKSQIFASFH